MSQWGFVQWGFVLVGFCPSGVLSYTLGGCAPRIEVIVKMQKKVGGVQPWGRGGLWGSSRGQVG